MNKKYCVLRNVLWSLTKCVRGWLSWVDLESIINAATSAFISVASNYTSVVEFDGADLVALNS